MEGIDKNTFKQIFYDHWDAFKLFQPRFDSPDYNDAIQKMFDCGDPNKMGFVQYPLWPNTPHCLYLQILLLPFLCQGLYRPLGRFHRTTPPARCYLPPCSLDHAGVPANLVLS